MNVTWEEFGSNGGIRIKESLPYIHDANIYRSSVTPAWLEWTIWTKETKPNGEAVVMNGCVRDWDSSDRAKQDCETAILAYQEMMQEKEESPDA